MVRSEVGGEEETLCDGGQGLNDVSGDIHV